MPMSARRGGIRGGCKASRIAWRNSSRFFLRSESGMISVKSKDLTPLIMWFCLVTGIIVLAFIRPGRIRSISGEYPLGLDSIFISLYVLWMLMELPVSKEGCEHRRQTDLGFCDMPVICLWTGSDDSFCPLVSFFLGRPKFCTFPRYRHLPIRSLLPVMGDSHAGAVLFSQGPNSG